MILGLLISWFLERDASSCVSWSCKDRTELNHVSCIFDAEMKWRGNVFFEYLIVVTTNALLITTLVTTPYDNEHTNQTGVLCRLKNEGVNKWSVMSGEDQTHLGKVDRGAELGVGIPKTLARFKFLLPCEKKRPSVS